MHCYQARANIRFLAGWHVHRQTSTPLVAGFVGWLASSSHQASVGGVSITTHFYHQPHISSTLFSITINNYLHTCFLRLLLSYRSPTRFTAACKNASHPYINLLSNPIPRTNTRQNKKRKRKTRRPSTMSSSQTLTSPPSQTPSAPTPTPTTTITTSPQPQSPSSTPPLSTLWWNTTLPPSQHTPTCPTYLLYAHSHAKERANLSTPDSQFERQSWPAVRALVAANRLDKFTRVPSELRRYRMWMEGVVREYGSVMRFVLDERLGWGEGEVGKAEGGFGNEGAYSVLSSWSCRFCRKKERKNHLQSLVSCRILPCFHRSASLHASILPP